MEANKLIIKSVFMTIGALFGLALIGMLICILLIPSAVMGFAYNVGMDETAAYFANKAYKRTGQVCYLANAVEYSMQAGNDERTVKYGDEFLSNAYFTEYCLLVDEKSNATLPYSQYVTGCVSVCKYKTGDKNNAIELAFESLNGRFYRGNAVSAVLVCAGLSSDRETVSVIHDRLTSLSFADESDSAYLTEMLVLSEKDF